MESVLFTEKPLKELKNTYEIGEEFEKAQSIFFHGQGIPLLVSPRLLRKKNLGQIDLAIIKNKKIIVIELKKNKTSLNHSHFSRQKIRLKASCDYLRFVINKDIILLFHSENDKNLAIRF